MANNKYDIFISYSRRNSEFVNQYANELSLLYSVWIDDEVITLGEEFWPRICKGITEASVFMLFVSKNSLKSPWVSREIQEAISNSKTVLVVKIDDADTHVYNAINEVEMIDLSQVVSVKDGIEIIVNSLQTHNIHQIEDEMLSVSTDEYKYLYHQYTPDTLFCFGNVYRDGFLTDKDYPKAYWCYYYAAKQGLTEAYYAIAILCKYKLEERKGEALKWLRLGAKSDNLSCLKDLTIFHKFDITTEEYNEYIHRVEEIEGTDLSYKLKTDHVLTVEEEKQNAVAMLKQDPGHAYSLLGAWTTVELKQKGTYDFSKVFHYYLSAAKHNDTAGMIMVAEQYQKTKDYARARYWYLRNYYYYRSHNVTNDRYCDRIKEINSILEIEQEL